MHLNRKKTLRILAYCATAGIFFGNMNLASAEIETESASNNEVTITSDSDVSGGAINPGDSTTGDASNNTANVSNTTTVTHILVGTTTVGNADGNTANIRDVSNVRFIDGGYAHRGYGHARYNIVNFYSGWANEIHGGHSHYGDALNNTVNMFGGTVGNEIGGGYSDYGNVNHNTLNIYGGIINGTAHGGRASYYGNSGDAIGNVVNIYGGKINGDVYGGWAPNGYARDNILNVYGAPDLSNANLYAGRGVSDDAVSGNKLNIYTKNITAKNIYSFESLNFYLPSNLQNGDTILRLTADADSNGSSADAIQTYGTDLSQTKVNVNADGGTTLNPGDTVTLLANSNGINLANLENDNILSKGVSLDYGLTLTPVTDSDGNVVAYNATVGDMIGGLKTQTQGFNSGPIDSASLLDSGTDRLLEWLPPESIELHGLDLNSVPTTGFDPFAGIGGSIVKIKTGPNSTLKTKNGGLNVGMARYLRNRHGAFVFGPVTDYGQDHYESTMEDGTKGAGNSKYFTAGIIARQMNIGGMYYEGSARYGRIQTNYASDNFLVHNEPTHAAYDSSAPCYAGHTRIGWRDKVSDQSILDAYGIYSLNRVSGMNAMVTTGERYSFSGVNSGRMRLGARLTRSVSEYKRFYSGLAYIHEFTGETHGNYIGINTKKSSLKGNYGLIELGWQTKPSKDSPVMLDAALVGMLGDHKGLTINAKFKRDF